MKRCEHWLHEEAYAADKAIFPEAYTYPTNPAPRCGVCETCHAAQAYEDAQDPSITFFE